MTPEEIIGPHYYYRVEGNQQIAVVPLTFGRARIVIGAAGSWTWNTGY